MQVAGMAWGEQFINYMHELEMAISSVVQFIYPWFLTLAIAQAAAVESPRQCQPEDSSS